MIRNSIQFSSVIKYVVIVPLLSIGITLPTYAKDVFPPSKPPNFTAKLMQGNSVELSWDESKDDNGIVDYRLLRNGVRVTKTDGKNFTDSNLEPGVAYRYDVIANDGTNSSYVSSVTITIPAVAK